MKILWGIFTGVFFLITGCFYDDGLLEEIERRVEEGKFFDDAEIDETVWERELPPYFDDTQ